MKENLITNGIDNKKSEIAQENNLFKEIRKMVFIKYLNLFFSIFRFALLFFILALLPYFPTNMRPTNFFVIMQIIQILILPLFTIINLITVITGVLGRNFLIKKDNNAFLECIKYICCCQCCLCSRNVSTLKLATFIFCLISFIWSFYILYYFIKDFSETINSSRFFPYLKKQVKIKIILYFADSLLLLFQSYFFYYYEFFLKRGEIYIEFYKRLIIKNRNKEASFVRNELPSNIDNFLINSGTEMNNV